MMMAGPVRPAYFLYTTLWKALDWVFPPTCPGCGQIGERWCQPCQQQVARIHGPVCNACGDPLPLRHTPVSHASGADLCHDCKTQPPEYKALR